MPQTNVDAALADYASRHGADLRRGTEVVALARYDDVGSVTTRPFRPDRGCDALDRVASSIILADVHLADPPGDGGLTPSSTPETLGFLTPYRREGWYRAMAWDRRHELDDDAPVGDDEPRGVLTEAFGRDSGIVGTGRQSRFHSDARQGGVVPPRSRPAGR